MQDSFGVFKTVANAARAEFIEKNSRFIGHIIPIRDEETAFVFIKQIKKEYYDATHNVFAYITADGQTARYSDDGEPKGTAGLPVLEVIKKRGNRCLHCRDKIFGGTLLGAVDLCALRTRGADSCLGRM